MLRSETSKKYARREMGGYFKKCRQSAKLSQVEVAIDLGITPQYLSNFENGRSTLSYPHIKKLVILYGISVDMLARTYLQLVKQGIDNDYKEIKKNKRTN